MIETEKANFDVSGQVSVDVEVFVDFGEVEDGISTKYVSGFTWRLSQGCRSNDFS